MHAQVPDKYKPVVFCNGQRVAFVPPTKVLSFPEQMSTSVIAPHAPICEQTSCADAFFPAATGRTTAMLRNIPNDYTRCMLTSLLDSEGFAGLYNFLYLPIDFIRGAGIGYAFVNMVSNVEADRFLEHFSGFSSWCIPSRKIADVSWSNPNQGLSVHIERYRNSTVMHHGVPDEYKPLILLDGCRVPFPAPTRAIRPPQM